MTRDPSCGGPGLYAPPFQVQSFEFEVYTAGSGLFSGRFEAEDGTVLNIELSDGIMLDATKRDAVPAALWLLLLPAITRAYADDLADQRYHETRRAEMAA